jgi:urease accessory protein
VSLARLLQLASPTLPVGAYSYSQGLEAAVEAGVVHDAASAERWIRDALELSVARLDAPLLWRMLQGEELNELFLATRETAEMRAECVQMGFSLARLLPEFGVSEVSVEEPSFQYVFAQVAREWKLDAREVLIAYLWSWLENQVMAAIKAVPLGQTAGQRMLLSLGERLEAIASEARSGEWSNLAPGLAMLSSRHETQYSRLFRS